MDSHRNFLGIYFNKDLVVRLASLAKIFSWIVVVVYGGEWFIQTAAMVLQISRGYWSGMGITDILQNVMYLFEQPLRGLVYFVVLQAVAQVLLIFMDVEENTRRAAREMVQK